MNLGKSYNNFSASMKDKNRRMGAIDRTSQADKKPFNEQLWHMGKVVGRVKGFFKLSTLPVVQ